MSQSSTRMSWHVRISIRLDIYGRAFLSISTQSLPITCATYYRCSTLPQQFLNPIFNLKWILARLPTSHSRNFPSGAVFAWKWMTLHWRYSKTLEQFTQSPYHTHVHSVPRKTLSPFAIYDLEIISWPTRLISEMAFIGQPLIYTNRVQHTRLLSPRRQRTSTHRRFFPRAAAKAQDVTAEELEVKLQANERPLLVDAYARALLVHARYCILFSPTCTLSCTPR